MTETEAVDFASETQDPEEAAKMAVKHAIELSNYDGKPADNTTAVVVFL